MGRDLAVVSIFPGGDSQLVGASWGRSERSRRKGAEHRKSGATDPVLAIPVTFVDTPKF